MKAAVTSSYEVILPVDRDPDLDAAAPDAAGGSEVGNKPVPLPRSTNPPKAECTSTSTTNTSTTNDTTDITNTNTTVDSVDKSASSPTSAPDSAPNGFPLVETTYSARPPRPPLYKCVAGKPKGDQSNYYSYTAAMAPAEKIKSVPARPPLPPPSSIYYDRLSAIQRLDKNKTDESRCSYGNLTQQTLTLYKDEMILCRSLMSTDGPEDPPRLEQVSQCEASPLQTRPGLPPFNPPPQPSPSDEPVYSELDYPPYLDVLPESRGAPTIRISEVDKSQYSPQNPSELEDINSMLRWLDRVSKSEVMPLYGLSIEEEISSFCLTAMNVKKALRLYNLLMMKRIKSLQDIITEFVNISSCLDKMQKKNRTIGIAGGTTGAVGGMTAVLGIALAPVTLGTSLIATAVGAGMLASVGGVSAHSAKKDNKKTVKRMKVEKLVYDYKKKIVDVEHCLDFVFCGMHELQRHDIARLQRAGVQADVLKTAHLSQFVMKNCTNYNSRASVRRIIGMQSESLLQAFEREMDQYFKEKDVQKLRKSCKNRFSGRVRLLAQNLHDELEHLHRIWEMFG